MKNFKIIKSLFFLCLIIFLSSCSNDDGLEEFRINNIESNNKDLINSYISSAKKNSDISAHFSSHFNDYQFYIDNEIVTLGEILEENNISSNGFYDLYVEKISNFQIKSLAKNGDDCEEEDGPTEGEIFAAMMAECDNYFLLHYPCRAAVEIAYVLR